MSNNCTKNDPCFCISTTTSSPPPCPTGQGDCCLKACNSIIECPDSVGPCGQVGSFDLSTLPHITTGCSGALTFILEGEDGLFDSVSISSAGILSWTTGDETTVDKYSTICFRIQCSSDCEDCLFLNSVGYITIGVNNLCLGVNCSTCEFCNHCTGECEGYPEKTVVIDTYDGDLIENVAIDVDEDITYDVICSDLLPKNVDVVYTVTECGDSEQKTQTFTIDCPEDCCDCNITLVEENTKARLNITDTGIEKIEGTSKCKEGC